MEVHMRTSLVTLAAGLAAALTACAGPRDYIDPKGSYPDAGTGNVEVPRTGELAVRAHPEYPWFRASKDTYGYHLPRFVVYDEQGRRVREVSNRAEVEGFTELTHARLPAGRYLVRVDPAFIEDDEPGVFWVTVSPDHLTVVDVDTLNDRRSDFRRERQPEPRVPPSE
jgi:hypothetical protein